MADNWIPRAFLGLFTLVVVGTLVASAGTSVAGFSPYNPEWDGTSDLRSTAADADVEFSVARDAAAFADAPPDQTVAFVVAPESSYRNDELAAMSSFVRDGGLLVVAADFQPRANEILGAVGATTRIRGPTLHDARSHYRSSALPVASNTSDHSLVADVPSLTLNYGTALRPNDATVLVRTTEYAYLDRDGSGSATGNESFASYPVATVEQIGDGSVVVVGDSSAFINAMLERPGNHQFVRALLSGHEHLLFDQLHDDSIPPTVLALLVVRSSELVQLGVGLVAVGVVAVWSRRPSFAESLVERWGDDGSKPAATFDRERLVAHLERRHPDWDRDRIERLVSSIQRLRDR